MNEQDLQDRMAASTAWTAQETLDPAADITRGRNRLRRKRAAIGSTAAAAVAVTALGFNALTNADTAEIDPAATPSTRPTPTVFPPPSGDTVLYALARAYVDEKGEHLSINHGLHGRGAYLSLVGDWSQDGGQAFFEMTFGDKTSEAEQELKWACKPTTMPGAFPLTCNWKTTSDGERFMVGLGTEDIKQGGKTYKGVKSYLVQYRRSDGKWTMMKLTSGLIEGDGKKPPVVSPDITVERMMEAVTDPRFTKDEAR